jgi:pimeloyl-ACP methyl ester carboxylesterase
MVDATADGKILGFDERNADESKPTILFIHGASSSSADFNLVIPHFNNNYHLLLPDLPAHGKSKDIVPLTRELAARLLANLIQQKALNGKAHIVGHSLGSHIAIELATKYPDVVDVVFVSGYGVASSAQALAYGLWIQSAAVSIAPAPLVRWLTSGTDIPPSREPNSLALKRDLARAMCFADDEWPDPWPARTLIIAAGKSGVLPTADNADHAKRLRDIGRKRNEATIAYTHREMRHPWCLQAPKLYAQTITQWIEQDTVPGGFELL